jgi:phage shock protein PspC (stress-responsive transcriptional regulator)
MHEKLYRSRRRRVIGGVAAGLGEYLNLDPILVRIIFIIVTLINGIGILLYIILWIVVPEEPLSVTYGFDKTEKDKEGEKEKSENSSAETKDFTPQQKGSGRIAAGIILIGLGVIFLSERFFPYFDFEDILPLALIVVGIGLLLNSFRK